MGRDWPAADIGAAAGADRRTRQRHRPGRHGAADRGAGARHPGPAAAAPDRVWSARRSTPTWTKSRARSANCSTSWHSRIRAHGGDDARSWRQARKEIAAPRMTEIVDALADQDDESLIEPGQMVVTITRDGFIKRTHAGDVPRAEPRRARAQRRGHARRRHRHPQLQRAYASVGAVLLVRRQGVPREGLATAGGRADGKGPRAGQPAAGTRRRHHHHRAAAAAGRDAVGQPAPRVRDRARAMCGATGCRTSATCAPPA